MCVYGVNGNFRTTYHARLAGLTEEQRKVVEDALVQLEKEHGVRSSHLYKKMVVRRDYHHSFLLLFLLLAVVDLSAWVQSQSEPCQDDL